MQIRIDREDAKSLSAARAATKIGFTAKTRRREGRREEENLELNSSRLSS
jgi:hypothetical protein